MKNFIQNERTFEELKVQEYIIKYVRELQRHFDMPDKTVRLVLMRVCKELKPKNLIKKMVCMIKSNK